MKKLLTLALISAFSAGCANVETKSTQTSKLPKNIIMVVGDGMGPAYTTAYRYFADNPNTEEIEKTVFDRNFVGMASTFPHAQSGYITDSAAAATALSTGFKTYNDAVGVDVNKQPLLTVLEYAKSINKKTGVVVTSQVNHATPASYLAHNVYRRNYNQIADSYLDNGIKADVYLGGGWKYFLREKRDLVAEFKQAGFQYVDKYEQLPNLNQDQPVLGLFANTGLPWALDDTDPHRLKTMTKAAIKQVENPNGFFMLIEGSQIDWSGHARDIATAMHEMDDLAKTLEYLESYVKQNPDTLVIVTADHSTGGLSMGRKTGKTDKAINSKYLWYPKYIRDMTKSPNAIAKMYLEQELTKQQISELLTFDITDEQMEEIKKSVNKGKRNFAKYLALPNLNKPKYGALVKQMA